MLVWVCLDLSVLITDYSHPIKPASARFEDMYFAVIMLASFGYPHPPWEVCVYTTTARRHLEPLAHACSTITLNKNDNKMLKFLTLEMKSLRSSEISAN
jgi:hypothetical protein